MDDSEIGRSHSPVDQFEQNFSRLGLNHQFHPAPIGGPHHLQPYQSIFTLPQAPFHAFRPPILSKSQSIPNNLSDRINDIINKNESIIGRFNNNTSQAGSRRNSASSSVDHQNHAEQLESQPVRKRAVRGPWRYEERILQLGYRPSSTASSTSSTSTVSSQRRNSLPVQSTLQQQLTRDCPTSRPYTKKQKFKRRASLPVIQAPHSLLESMENHGGFRHCVPTPGAAGVSAPRAIRTSVITINPAHRPHTTSPSILPTTVEATPPPAPISTIVEPKSRSWDNLAMMNDDDEGADSDGSELIIVDDDQSAIAPPSWEQQQQTLSKPSVISSVIRPIHQTTTTATRPHAKLRRVSSDGYPHNVMAGDLGLGSGLLPAKKLKTDAVLSPNVLRAVEEVKRNAQLTAQPTSLINIAVVNPFPMESARIIQTSKTGDEPNATLHYPLPNRLPNRQPPTENYDSDDDVDGVPIEEDEEDARPYKCYECQKGFRISGHLARHIKAEIHIKRVQELRELGIQTSQFHPLKAPKPNEDELVISDRTVSSTTSDNMQIQQPLSPTSAGLVLSGADWEAEADTGGRRFKCATCSVAFRFQGHLDRHYRSTMHQSMVEAMENGGRVSSSL